MQTELNSHSNVKKWYILLIMAISVGMNHIDQSALVIALPSIQETFNYTPIMTQWVLNAYLLPFAIFMSIGGKLGDLFQHHRIFLFGLIIFFFSSIGCGIAFNGLFLLINRMIQGIGAALMLPNATVIIMNSFSTAEKGKAMGIYIGLSLLFIPLALVLGGLFTEFLNWRYIFIINVPLGLFCYICGYLFLKDTPWVESDLKFDFAGALALLIALSCLVIALMEWAQLREHPEIIALLLTSSFVGFIWFYLVESKAEYPLINFRIFHNNVFLTANILFFCISTAFSLFVFEAIYYQKVLLYSPLITSLLFFPSIACVIIGSPVAGRLFDRYGYLKLVIIGLSLTLMGLFLNQFLVFYENYWYLVPGIIFIGLGAALVLTPINIAALYSADEKDRGTISGVLSSVRQIASTVTLAMQAGIILGHNRYLLKKYILLNRNYSGLTTEHLSNLLYHSDIAQVKTNLNYSQLQGLVASAKQAYISSYSLGLFAASLSICFGLLMTYLLLIRHKNFNTKPSP